MEKDSIWIIDIIMAVLYYFVVAIGMYFATRSPVIAIGSGVVVGIAVFYFLEGARREWY